MHYRNERNLTAMLSHPAYLFLQGSPLCSVFLQVPVPGATCGDFSPGLGNSKPERTTLGQSLQGLTSLFLQSSLFIGARNKELRAYGQQSTYKAKIESVKDTSRTSAFLTTHVFIHDPFSQATSLMFNR